MTTIHLDRPDLFIKEIISKSFPNYSGRKLRISTRVPTILDSYWDGGSKTSYVFYCPATKQASPVHDNHPFFEKDQPRHLAQLPSGILLVAHSIFCGKDMGITIYANETDVIGILPEKASLSKLEEIVLLATRCFKSSYAGIKDFRFHEANRKFGISLKDWNDTKIGLINRGLLNKAGAITTSGKNAIEGKQWI